MQAQLAASSPSHTCRESGVSSAAISVQRSFSGRVLSLGIALRTL